MLKDRVEAYNRGQDYNCAETILRVANDEYKLGLSEKALRLMGGFGGGMGCEGVCGALSASIAVISALKIQDKAHGTPGFRTLCGDYVALFEKELGSTNCHELKKKYFKKETTHCLETVEKTADLLEKFLEQHR